MSHFLFTVLFPYSILVILFPFTTLWYEFFWILHPKFGWTHISQNFRFEMFELYSVPFFVSAFYTALFSASGLTFIGDSSLFDTSKMIFTVSVIFGVLLDFLILSSIASKNQKFLQNNPEKSAKNPHFIIFFIFWRIFLPDIFVASSLSAHYSRMTLNKKQIFLISFWVQLIRISMLVVMSLLFK